jgi:hypothetical protein
MAPTSFTHGREKCPSGRRNNEPRIRRAKGTRIIEQQKHVNKTFNFQLFWRKLKRQFFQVSKIFSVWKLKVADSLILERFYTRSEIPIATSTNAKDNCVVSQ